MPFIKVLSSKLGIFPSMRSGINMEKLTGTQKLQLTSARIFGHSIGGNLKNGNKALKKNLKAEGRASQFDIPSWDPSIIFPYIDNPNIKAHRKMIDDGRKMRIMMRGVKIGKQKGGTQISIMSIYEKKKEAMS